MTVKQTAIENSAVCFTFFAVFQRCDFNKLSKRLGEIAWRGKTGLCCNCRERIIGRPQQIFAFFDSFFKQVLNRRNTICMCKAVGKMIFVPVNMGSQHIECNRFPEVYVQILLCICTFLTDMDIWCKGKFSSAVT